MVVPAIKTTSIGSNSFMKNTFDVATISSFTKPVPINKIVSSNLDRIILQNMEFNRILGGGLVPGLMSLMIILVYYVLLCRLNLLFR